MIRLLAAILTLLLAIAPAWAAKRVALVIGNDDYQEVPKLQKAVNDARAVAQRMTSIGFEVDLGENLTRREFNDKFARLLDRIEPGDTAFLFYAGHGIALNGQNILLPVDIPGSESANLVKSEGLIVDDLLEEVKGKGAAVSFFVLDACRNNPFASSGKRSIGNTRGLQLVAPPQGSFVLMSAGAGQAALDRLSDADGDPNSVFTRKLLPLLSTPGLTHVAIAKQVQTQVEDMARTIGHEQKPSYYDEISGEFVLDPSGAAPAATPPVAQPPVTASPPAADAALTEWNAVKDMNSIAVLRNFRDKYAGTPYAGYAAARIEELQAAQPKPKPAPEPQRQASVEPPPAAGGLAVAQVKPGWYVVLGSFPYNQEAKARQRLSRARDNGWRAALIDTGDYGSLSPGYYAVVVGPYARAAARTQAEKARGFVADAYARDVR